MPARYGIPGNESAYAAAKARHNAVTHLDIPFAMPHAMVLIHKNGNTIAKSWWNAPRSHHARLNMLNPNLRLRVASNVSRPLETILHRLCLGVAYTRKHTASRLCAPLHRTAFLASTQKQSNTHNSTASTTQIRDFNSRHMCFV